MVRIIKEKQENFSPKAQTTLNLVAVMIADQPSRIAQLLKSYGIQLSNALTPSELSTKVIRAIEKEGESFHVDLAKLIMQKVTNDGFDSFAPAAIAGISGALTSIAGLFGNKQKSKMMQQQAQSRMMANMMAYKAQQEQMAAQMVSKEKQQANQMMMLKAAGLIALVLLLVAGFVYKKRQAKPQVVVRPPVNVQPLQA